MKIRTLAALIGLGLSISFTSALACTVEDWKACAGKPWVNGTNMETPLGEKWWPNALWGADDQAGSTNWYKKRGQKYH